MKAEEALIYLTACAVNQEKPVADVVLPVDMDLLYKYAYFHQVTALVATQLKSLGISDQRFKEELVTSTWKNMVVDSHQKEVLSGLEKAGIRYLPLKGCIIKKEYPKPEYRQMSDVDILVEADKIEQAVRVMKELGFTQTSEDIVYDTSFKKPPVSVFEIHKTLFTKVNPGAHVYEYYRNVFDWASKDEGNDYGYHFTDEDFYIYTLMHEYKHFKFFGAGLRCLLDTYVYLKKHAKHMDWEYIRGETEKLGIRDFEVENRRLSLKIFRTGIPENLTYEERKLLNYHLTSGAYGTDRHRFQNKVRKKGLLPYVWGRVFLPMRVVKIWYPFFAKHKILLPLLPLYRLIKFRKSAKEEVSLIRQTIQDKPEELE